jgi:hypothetical protein
MKRILKGSQKGQSLVEMAFALPMLLFLAVGIVELGYALNSYEQTINAAREGARFGSFCGGYLDSYEGCNNDVTSIVQGATSGLIQYRDYGDDGGNADLYIAHMDISQDCSEVEFEQQQTLDTADFETAGVTQDDMLNWLSEHGYSYCGLSFVAVDLHYRSPSFLRLPLVKQLSEATPMRSLTVMRKEFLPVTGHCGAYPIAAYWGVFEGMTEGDLLDDIWIGGEAGGWGWLRWKCDPNDAGSGSADTDGTLADYLTPPADADSYENPQDCSDNELAVGKYVWGNTGVSNSSEIVDALDGLIGRYIRVIVWDYTNGETGSALQYHVKTFAIVQITGYALPPGHGGTISARFVRYDETGCE